jgi:hypothetical protein
VTGRKGVRACEGPRWGEMRVFVSEALELEEAIFLRFESWESRYIVGESWRVLERERRNRSRSEARRSEAAVL